MKLDDLSPSSRERTSPSTASYGGATFRIAGITVSGSEAIIVVTDLSPDGRATIQVDDTWALQAGARPHAYSVMFHRVRDFLKAHSVGRAVIKASAVNPRGMGAAHLNAAELRGVIAAAAAEVCEVEVIGKASVSRNFGSRKADAYLKDENFWTSTVTGKLRSGSRQAALVILASLEPK